jgi:hypothetical protein
MTTKDRVLSSFLEHSLISEKYNINNSDIPKNLREALKSEHTVIKAIALIIDEMETAPAKSDESLRRKIIAFLNEATS